MRPPFSEIDFIRVFSEYNDAVWPMQPLLWVAAIVAFLMVFSGRGSSSRVASWFLAIFWAWAGIVYHLAYFASLNAAARLFGALFIAQAALFAFYGGIRRNLRLRLPEGWGGTAGFLLILYSLVFYPLIWVLSGRAYMDSPTFGSPCPTVIFTIGMFFFFECPFPSLLLVIPVIWSVIGGSAAIFLGIPQDAGLIASGILAAALLVVNMRRGSSTRKAEHGKDTGT
jgi:hypothetical protein